jgi:FXSXX-COOH protein
MNAGDQVIATDLLDTRQLLLDDLADLPDSVLAHLLRRVVDEALTPSCEPVSAFQSAL